LATALQWRPDLAVIATPSDLHANVLPDLLDARVATYIEKPVVIRGTDAEALAARLATKLPPTQVGCVLRFLPAVDVLAGWLAERRLGNLIRARLECGQYLPDWRPNADYREVYSASRDRGGGVIFDLVHEMDLAVHLFGDCTLEHVQAGRRSTLDIACEDVAHLSLAALDGLPIAIGLDYVSRVPVRSIEIVGEDASARLDFIARTLDYIGADGFERSNDGFDSCAAYRAAMEELVLAVESGSPTKLPLHEGLRATRLAIEAHSRATESMAA
jgi:predicted dehydrogenase